MTQCDLEPDHLERERQIVCNEVRMRSNATSDALDALRRALYRFGYDHTASGQESIVKNFSVQQAVSFFSLSPFLSVCIVAYPPPPARLVWCILQPLALYRYHYWRF